MKTKRTVIALILCLVLLLTFGCAATASSDEAYMTEASGTNYESYDSYDSYDTDSSSKAAAYLVSEDSAETTTTAESGETGDFDVRKIVYTADMQMTTDDPRSALNELVAKADGLGGYVSASYSKMDDDGSYYSTATIKVPADKLDELVSMANTLGTVDNYRLSSDDISLSYYDTQARLDNAKAEEQQLLEVLAKCETVEDILKVRESLTSVRADIESYTAQINLWDNLVSYATLDVTIYRTEKTAVEGETQLIQVWKASDVWSRMDKGFQNSARFVVNAIGAIGIFLAIAVIPAGILFLAIGLPIIVHRKKKHKKLAAKAAENTPAPEPDDTTKKNE